MTRFAGISTKKKKGPDVARTPRRFAAGNHLLRGAFHSRQLPLSSGETETGMQSLNLLRYHPSFSILRESVHVIFLHLLLIGQ
jgi:hypothetical protein